MVTQPNAIVLYPSVTSAAPVHATYMGGWRSAMVAGVMIAMVATVAHVMSDCVRPEVDMQKVRMRLRLRLRLRFSGLNIGAVNVAKCSEATPSHACNGPE